jgi:hypothetical protein
MALICSVTRFVLSFISAIFSTLLGKHPDPGAAPKETPETSQTDIPVRIRRTQVIEVEFQHRASKICAAVFHREKDGTLVCAMVHERGKDLGFWRTLPFVVSELASGQPAEKLKWVLISYQTESRGEFNFEVWEALLSREDNGALMVSWSVARPEYATEWIHRVQTAMELIPRIRTRQLTAKERKHRVA